MRKPAKPRRDTVPTSATRKTFRCAIYTRKSSEEGLDMEFNSLDAQREACEASIASQESEGWVILSQMYDDGGISGGTMERPALQRLLSDVAEGLIDTVVVYKVDRLTRSLSDFAKIVDVFDAANVSFVSVTQSFNTTTSMGRLTLNMLLSFAQFEREVTGERIRDKIAASKAKGLWMGGLPPLGYEVRDRKLEIVEAEAETVRHIFARYAELRSVLDLRDELAGAGIRSKQRVDRFGRATGGGPLHRGALYHLLQNRLYRGEIVHKGKVHPGQQRPIVEADLWDRVQARLADNRVDRKTGVGCAAPSLLVGLLRDEAGDPMTPTHANKQGRRYRYYVSHSLIAGRAKSTESGRNIETGGYGGETPEAQNIKTTTAGRRVPAADLEALVQDRIQKFLADEAALYPLIAPGSANPDESRQVIGALKDLANTWSALDLANRSAILNRLIESIIVRREGVDIAVRSSALTELASGLRQPTADGRANAKPGTPKIDAPIIVLTTVAIVKRVGMETRMRVAGPAASDARPPDRSLLRLLARAQRFRERLTSNSGETIADLAAGQGVTPSYFTRVVRLAFLAPDITAAILDGRQPLDLSAQKLSLGTHIPLDWKEQAAVLGF